MMIITDDSGKIFHAEMMLDVEHEAEELRLFGRALLVEVKKLKAQNERLREMLNYITTDAEAYTKRTGDDRVTWAKESRGLLYEIPEQSLEAVKAEAVREAVTAVSTTEVKYLCGTPYTAHIVETIDLLTYADKLEKGET